MKIELPKDVLGSLPAPDSQGLVRVTAAIKLGSDGTADIVEINDEPLPVGDDAEKEANPDNPDDSSPDDSNPMPSMPDMSGAPDSLY